MSEESGLLRQLERWLIRRTDKLVHGGLGWTKGRGGIWSSRCFDPVGFPYREVRLSQTEPR